jgi:hypothetical protein
VLDSLSSLMLPVIEIWKPLIDKLDFQGGRTVRRLTLLQLRRLQRDT